MSFYLLPILKLERGVIFLCYFREYCKFRMKVRNRRLVRSDILFFLKITAFEEKSALAGIISGQMQYNFKNKIFKKSNQIQF